MSRIENLQELRGEIARYRDVSSRLINALRQVETHDIERIGKTTTTAVAIAGLIENSYTAVETVLFRIAQNFGNNLDATRWHTDLLRRMTLSIPDVRPAVIGEATYARLDELMRFRHFKRYYFNLDYDWSRLQYLAGVVHKTIPETIAELTTFDLFLTEMIASLSEQDG
jgi:hypothetical protein